MSGFEKFLEIIGGDRPVQEITKAHCREYKETLLKFPRSMPADQRKLPVGELLKVLMKSPPARTLGASTVNKYLHNLSHLFDWSKGQGFYEGENPVEGLVINKRKHGDKEKRKPFSDEDLVRTLRSEGFRSQEAKHPERYWMLLILLHTGARREEIAQLGVADVRQQDGVWFFDITPDEELGKQVKTQGSKRRVPIHSALLALGLLKYVEEMRKRKNDRLFPMLEKGRNGSTAFAIRLSQGLFPQVFRRICERFS
jgi:integrase